MIGSRFWVLSIMFSSASRRRSRRGKHGPHTLEFPDPGRRWRLLFILLALIAGMALTTVMMRKMATVGDLEEATDFRKTKSHRIR